MSGKKFVTGLAGILLLPAAAGLGGAMYQALVELQMADSGARILLGFFAGAILWLLLFVTLPRPLRSYILAHELSHLLAAWLSGVRAGRLRVGRDRGSVEVERSSIWIALAPYLIPFYSLVLILAHHLAKLWWDPARWSLWIPFGLGLTWSFHLSFTLHMLSVPQSDVQPYGRAGAYSLILCGNLMLLCLAVFYVNGQPIEQDLRLLLQTQSSAYRMALEALVDGFFMIKNAIIQG